MKMCDDCAYYNNLCRELTSDNCPFFENKHHVITLPCEIGDYCIWHDDLWYVNGIGYFNDKSGDFLLWMSMADKSPCGAEAISSEVKFISQEDAEKMLKEMNSY